MGIRFYCPNGHKLHVKSFLAGKRGICPYCGITVQIPLQSTRPSSKELRRQKEAGKLGSPGLEPGPISGAGFPATAEGPQQLSLYPVDIKPDDPPWMTRLGEAKAASDLLGPEATGRPVGRPHPSGGAPFAPASAASPAIQSGPPMGRVFSPLDEDPTAAWYVMPPEGGRYGPASPAVMRTWMMEGRIGLDTLVWRSGWPEWKRAEEVFPNLAKFLESLRQRLTPSYPAGAHSVRPVPTTPMAAGTSVAQEADVAGQSYWIPVIIAMIVGGISLAVIALIIFART